MRKHDQGSAAAARDRKGRFSARRKRATVLRLLRGEDLESVSRELGITAARASPWRDQFLAAGQAGLKSRAPDARDEEHQRLHAKVGELLVVAHPVRNAPTRTDPQRPLPTGDLGVLALTIGYSSPSFPPRFVAFARRHPSRGATSSWPRARRG